MSKLLPWLDDKHIPLQPDTLSADELLEEWRSNRNNMVSLMAANEMMRRIDAKILTVEPYPRLRGEMT